MIMYIFYVIVAVVTIISLYTLAIDNFDGILEFKIFSYKLRCSTISPEGAEELGRLWSPIIYVTFVHHMCPNNLIANCHTTYDVFHYVQNISQVWSIDLSYYIFKIVPLVEDSECDFFIATEEVRTFVKENTTVVEPKLIKTLEEAPLPEPEKSWFSSITPMHIFMAAALLILAAALLDEKLLEASHPVLTMYPGIHIPGDTPITPLYPQSE